MLVHLCALMFVYVCARVSARSRVCVCACSCCFADVCVCVCMCLCACSCLCSAAWFQGLALGFQGSGPRTLVANLDWLDVLRRRGGFLPHYRGQFATVLGMVIY